MNKNDTDMADKIAFSSGATSSVGMPEYHLVPGEIEDLIAMRFAYGNHKHEDGNTVLAEANWLRAYRARDIAFFRDRAAHARKHLKRESRGDYDGAPGGNLGAVGWWLEVAAFINKHDPLFYDAINGLRPMNSLPVQNPLPPELHLRYVPAANAAPERDTAFETELVNRLVGAVPSQHQYLNKEEKDVPTSHSNRYKHYF